MKKIFILTGLILFFGAATFAAPIDITFDDGVYHITLKGKSFMKKVKFFSSEALITNREAHLKARAKLTVNAGFFDPQNGKTISYIVADRLTVEDPLFNENLTSDPILRKNLDKILNRTEFRVVECDANRTLHYEIVPHKSPVDFGCVVRTSAQAGPLVYPQLKLEEEFFIVKNKDGEIVRESASVLHKTARTIIGIKGNDELHILIFTDEHPMDLYDVQAYVKNLGLDRAMAFDGGSSTSMNYLDKYEVISTKGDGGGRSLKSFLVVN